MDKGIIELRNELIENLKNELIVSPSGKLGFTITFFDEFNLSIGDINIKIEARLDIYFNPETKIISVEEMDVQNYTDSKMNGVADLEKFKTHLVKIGLLDPFVNIYPKDEVLFEKLKEVVLTKALVLLPMADGYSIDRNYQTVVYRSK